MSPLNVVDVHALLSSRNIKGKVVIGALVFEHCSVLKKECCLRADRKTAHCKRTLISYAVKGENMLEGS